jgi:exosortase/archaeosortase family protein
VPFFDRLLERLLLWNAAASGALLNLLGQHTHITGTVINSIRFSTNVRRGCDAVEPAWFFDSAVLAFPAPWARRWVAIAAGTVLIGVVNVVRVASLFLIGVYYPRAFEAAHLEVWPAAFILFAAGLWVTWLVWLRRAPAHAQA